MQAAVDVPVLLRRFRPTTFARGVAYATTGAVLEWTYDPSEDIVYAEVQGGRLYEVTVEILRDGGGPLDFDGECSCPVGYDCKHVVAALIESCAEWGDARLEDGHVENPASWEGPLRGIIGALDRGRPEEARVAIQFELVTGRPTARRQDPPKPGIQIRPVVSGARGWVRTGISWSKLEYGHQYAEIGGEQRSLLREILALHRLSARFYGYSYRSSSPEPPIWLEDISSRRLWDLLGQAQDAGMPLVAGGKAAKAGNASKGVSGVVGEHGPAVRLLPEPAMVKADLVEAEGGLRMTPWIEAGGESVRPLVLIGDPPHGLAWWREEELLLAPFDRAIGQGEQALLGSQLEVPARDRTRFLSDFYPRLARSMEVVSSDRSVELPEVARPRLVLSVRHDQHRSRVRWQQGMPGSTWREDLWSGEIERDLEGALAAATGTARAMPALLEPHWSGDRLVGAVELSGMDAVRFVTGVLPALAAIAGLVVEEEGTRPHYREAEGAPVVSLSPSRDVDGDWFDLLVEVSVDGEEVTFQELFVALAEGRSHLVLPSGTYFALDRPELAQLAELIAEAKTMEDRATAGGAIRLSRFHVDVWEDLRRIGVVTEQAAAWDQAVRSLSEAATTMDIRPPEDLDATLRPYQENGFAWLEFLYRNHLGGILADDMGLGKTLQALALICRARPSVTAPFLVVAPTSVVDVWVSECRRFAPQLAVETVRETRARRPIDLADVAGKADVVVTSYTLFRLEHHDYETLEWAGVFLDEAQFVKNPAGLAHRRLKALDVPFKLAMTGTPIENNLRELWALLSITAPGLFPRWDRFAEHFAQPIERRGDTERLDQLRRRIRPLMLRRTKEQVASDLPEKQEQVLEIELSPKHRRFYQLHLQRERQKVLGLLGDLDRHRIEVLRSLTVLRQAALDISLVDDDGEADTVASTKLDVLMEMLGEIVADGHRVLVFSQFTRFLSSAAARAGAAGIEHCYLDGKSRRRAKLIEAFRDGEAPVFFISLKAGGFGLNLTEADYCILLDPWWNPATEAQAVDRAHRIGQTRKVMVYRLVAKDTIEEKVMALKAKKAALFASVMDAGGFESAALSASDIRALLG